jgi:hypothetical protein
VIRVKGSPTLMDRLGRVGPAFHSASAEALRDAPRRACGGVVGRIRAARASHRPDPTSPAKPRCDSSLVPLDPAQAQVAECSRVRASARRHRGKCPECLRGWSAFGFGVRSARALLQAQAKSRAPRLRAYGHTLWVTGIPSPKPKVRTSSGARADTTNRSRADRRRIDPASCSTSFRGAQRRPRSPGMTGGSHPRASPPHSASPPHTSRAVPSAPVCMPLQAQMPQTPFGRRPP